MRAFAIFCIAFSMYWGYTAVTAMREGSVHPMKGDTTAVHRRDDPKSQYQKYLIARWLACVGFLTLAGVMNYSAGMFEKLEDGPPETPEKKS